MNILKKVLQKRKKLPDAFRYARKASQEAGVPYFRTLFFAAAACVMTTMSGREFYEEEAFRAVGLRHLKAIALNTRWKPDSIRKIMDRSGWSYEKTIEETTKTRKRIGCFYHEYNEYRFWELTPQQQDRYLLAIDRYTVEERFNKNRKRNSICKNKYLADSMLKDFIKRPFCMNREMSFEQFSGLFADQPKVFYKPVDKCHGAGAQSFTLTKETMREVYDRIHGLPNGIVEGFVCQHEAMKTISPNAVSTVRLVTISSSGQRKPLPSGRTEELVYSALKMGGGNGVVDNLIGGGLGAGIDFETGTVLTDAVDVNGIPHAVHPTTGTVIKGFQIPYYKEAVAMVLECTRRFKLPGFLGWDVAITNNGPVVIEVNTDPCESLLNLPYVSDPQGFKYLLEPYKK